MCSMHIIFAWFGFIYALWSHDSTRRAPLFDCIVLRADDALRLYEHGSLPRRGGCFYWATLANEAAGGPILRKGLCT